MLLRKIEGPHKIGLCRNITTFLWIPTKIGNEWRWLERVNIVQQWTKENNWPDAPTFSWKNQVTF
tara:strand:+ start:345 stop:539 length:195 start_codon:yes stop_codon:yes gene_type:complete